MEINEIILLFLCGLVSKEVKNSSSIYIFIFCSLFVVRRQKITDFR